MTFFFHFVFVHNFQTKSVFLIYEHYLKIINLLYLNQEPVYFDKIFRFQCKFKKTYFVDDFLFILGPVIDSRLTPPSEEGKIHFWFEKMLNVLKHVQNNFSIFLLRSPVVQNVI